MSPGPFPPGVDSIGTIPSALATYAAVLALQPYLIINAGTAGGSKVVGTILSQEIVLELLVYVSKCLYVAFFISLPSLASFGSLSCETIVQF